MADSDFQYVPDTATDPDASPTWGDYAKTGAASVTGGVAAPAAAIARQATTDSQNPTGRFVNAMAKILQHRINEATDDINESRTDVAKQRAEAAITSPEFWDHPISSMALKATGMSGPLAAAIFSGGPIGSAIVNGALAGGEYENQIDKMLDGSSDEDLKKNDYYASLRSMGVSEDDARIKLKSKIVGNKDLLNFVGGAVAGAIGPAGKAAAGVAGKATVGLADKEAGVLGRTAAGAGEGAAGGALQGGIEDVTTQQAQVDLGQKKEIDQDALAQHVLEGGALGGALGGVAGAAVKERPAKPTGKKVEDNVPDANQTTPKQGRGDEDIPVSPAAPGGTAGGPQSVAPTPPEAKAPQAVSGLKPKTRDAKTNNAKVETVDAVAPTAEQAVALDTVQPKAEAPVQPQQPAPAPDNVASPAPKASVPQPPAEAAPAAPVQNQPVTPEVTPEQPSSPAPMAQPGAENAPVNSAPVAEQVPAPATPVSRTGRVLQAIKDKAAQEAEAKANKAALRQMNKNAREVEEGPSEPSGKHWSKDELAEREANATNAKKIFEEHAPEDAQIPADKEGREALRDRIGKMLDAAKEAGVKIPAKVGYEGTSDHVVYLRDAADLHRSMGTKSFVGKKRDQRIADFLIGERAAKQGDFSVLRERRKVEGDLAKRKSADVEHVESAQAAGSQTKVGSGASSARAAKDVSEGEASKGRKLEGAEKAKAIAEFIERQKKGKVDLAAQRSAPPEATSAKVVDKAAQKTNTEPTEAQKQAGNYAKGTVEWNGLHIAIENPKGSVRKGKSAGGHEWSVEMPDHYGYVKRSEGADGDQVDVYMGPHPESKDVYVIHQQNFDGEFDEHKAMLGYKSRADAMQAYDQAFSDGRGFERVKDIESMSADEFKNWVKSDAPKKAPKEHAAVDGEAGARNVSPDEWRRLTDAIAKNKSSPEVEKIKAQIDEAIANEGIESNLGSTVPMQNRLNPGQPVPSLRKIAARDVLKDLDLQHLSGVPKAIGEMMRKHLATMVGDTDVHIVSRAQMAQLTGELADAFADEGQGVLGKAHISRADGKATVLIRNDQFASPERIAHAAMHEIAHAWTMRALVEDKTIYRRVQNMMKETEAFLKDVPDLRDKLAYALTDEREFIAEAFSNPEVQEVLAGVPLSKEMAQTLGLHMQRPTMWHAIVSVVRGIVERLSGRIPEGHRMIEGLLHLGGDFDRHVNSIKARRLLKQDTSVKVHDTFNEANLRAKVEEKVKDILDQPSITDKPWLLRWRTMDQIAQVARDYGLPQVRKVADVIEMMRLKSAVNLKKSEPVISKLYELERKYKGAMWEKFTSLVHDETMANVFADRDLASQTHLGKDALHGMWGKAQHADLAARYKELPEDLKAARTQAMKFFTDQQNQMSLGIIKNRILKVLGVNDDALARRIHEGRTLDTDADTLGGADTLQLIREAKELAKIEGPYFPLMRRGEYVVRATHDIAAPDGAPKLADNQFEFRGKKARDEAIAFAQKQDHKADIKSVWVDKDTGKTSFPDGTKVTSQDMDAEQRFQVTVQNRHVEFHETAKAAQQRADELEAHGLKVEGVQRRRFEGGQGADLLSHHMEALARTLRRRETYNGMSAGQKNEVEQTLREMSLRMLGSTRIQTKRLPRRYVEGASHDLTRNTWEYAQSTAGYLAKLEHQPALDDALKAMHEGVDADSNKTTSLGRSEIAREVDERINKGFFPDKTNKAFDGVAQRIMTLSFLDKLFSPAFNVVNSLQPAMVTMPTLAGRYGVGRSFEAMSRAYRDIAGLSIVKKGVADTIGKIKDSQHEGTNFLDEIKGRLKSADEKAMLDYLAERGSIDRESGMEVAKLIKARDGALGKFDTGLGYMEGVARQMPQAIEMMNRAVTALATYRLERMRGADHDAAMVKAQENVNNTQGLYSASNAAPIFNHPLAKLSFQFKKYGQMMYHLMGSNIGKALHGASKEEKYEAMKTLAGLAATHAAMAGALGLPTEPFKYLVMGAHAAGLTDTSWGDVENKVREFAADHFGKAAGEVITKGLPRLAGIDLSSRVGADSWTSFGEPRNYKESDVKAWLFDTVAGAPTALVADWVKGANQLMGGNYSKAAELMVPNKFAADSIRAYREMTEGKKSGAGRQTMAPYSVAEAATRAFGFTPRREAEQSAQNSAFYSASSELKDKRKSLVDGWVTAKPADKISAWKAIQKFNTTVPKDAQIGMGELNTAKRRRDTEKTRGTVVNGIGVNKHDRYLLDKSKATYNP